MKLSGVLVLLVIAFFASVHADSMSDFETALAEFNAAVSRGDITQEDLDNAADMEDDSEDADEPSNDVSAFVEHGTSSDSCRYRCNEMGRSMSSSGWVPRPDPSYKPTYNGCGAAGGGWLASTVRRTLSAVPPTWKRCCDRHDLCYARCNSSKSACDNAMLRCMTREISLYKLKATQTADERKCVRYGLDKVFYEAVNTLGCIPFIEAQRDACLCSSEFRITHDASGRPI
eukprot:TRINITY_DN78888_c0_g1_i1.p1 TRINITY_DN78888_c0_g1~~TRINITY_DN78888_c0_g1_i1.p1  ORF type:complete len:230 (+),score=20.21 TRINITY_DN78888_c0_g1_i1:29-718(+)